MRVTGNKNQPVWDSKSFGKWVVVPVYSTKTLYILRERIQQHLLNNSLNFKDTCTFFALFSTLSSILINFKGWWGPQLYSFCESAAQSFIIATAKKMLLLSIWQITWKIRQTELIRRQISSKVNKQMGTIHGKKYTQISRQLSYPWVKKTT